MPIQNEFDFSHLAPAMKEELDRRMAAEEAGEMTYSSWGEVKARSLKK